MALSAHGLHGTGRHGLCAGRRRSSPRTPSGGFGGRREPSPPARGSPDLEAGETFGLFVLHRDVLDAGARRATPTPINHLAHRVGLTLEYCLDPAVLEVLDPAVQAQLFSPVLRGAAEVDALHLARDENVRPFLLSHLHPLSSRSPLWLVVSLPVFIPYARLADHEAGGAGFGGHTGRRKGDPSYAGDPDAQRGG